MWKRPGEPGEPGIGQENPTPPVCELHHSNERAGLPHRLSVPGVCGPSPYSVTQAPSRMPRAGNYFPTGLSTHSYTLFTQPAKERGFHINEFTNSF